MVKEMNRSETRNGMPYLALTLVDRSGEISGRLWENADQLIDECQPGTLVLLGGQAQAYKGTLQLKISKISAVSRNNGDQAVDMGLFIPSTTREASEMAEEILGLARSVQDRHLQKLLLRFFKPGNFFERFQRAPAAKIMHHAYLGGLLEHTISVARLADMLSAFYPAIDRSLLVAGALLHDIGKTEEFSFDSYPFNYTDKGRLVGHLVLGTEMVLAEIEKINDFPADLSIRLQHMILSHHGQFEFGSPCLPMMLEAFVLNFLDDLDAKVNFFGRLEEGLSGPGYQWTDYQRMLERFLFIKARTASDHDPAEPTPGQEQEGSKQQKLF